MEGLEGLARMFVKMAQENQTMGFDPQFMEMMQMYQQMMAPRLAAQRQYNQLASNPFINTSGTSRTYGSRYTLPGRQ